MKVASSLALVLIFASVSFGQGVRMSADFLPLAVGNQWVYEIVNEDGERLGEMDFTVQEHAIISGRSFYVLSQFPFAFDADATIRLLRYDRAERQFIRMYEDDEGPLFLSDGATTRVLETDSAGLPQKFLLQMDTAALTFQRGVGIVEARMQTANGIQIAKISRVRVGEGLPGSGNASATAAADAGVAEARGPRSEADRARDLIENVATVDEANPRMELRAESVRDGVKFTLEVTNISDKLLPFKFSSGQTYDFVVSNPSTGREVWRWSRGNFFSQVVRSEAIRAGGSWTFEGVWNRRDNDVNPVEPGQYRVIAIIAADPPLQSEPILIEVQ